MKALGEYAAGQHSRTLTDFETGDHGGEGDSDEYMTFDGVYVI